jgi:hypothetical protein
MVQVPQDEDTAGDTIIVSHLKIQEDVQSVQATHRREKSNHRLNSPKIAQSESQSCESIEGFNSWLKFVNKTNDLIELFLLAKAVESFVNFDI